MTKKYLYWILGIVALVIIMAVADHFEGIRNDREEAAAAAVREEKFQREVEDAPELIDEYMDTTYQAVSELEVMLDDYFAVMQNVKNDYLLISNEAFIENYQTHQMEIEEKIKEITSVRYSRYPEDVREAHKHFLTATRHIEDYVSRIEFTARSQSDDVLKMGLESLDYAKINIREGKDILIKADIES